MTKEVEARDQRTGAIDCTEETLEKAAEWQAAFDTADDGVAILDGELQILRANQVLARWCSTSPEALTGRFCYELIDLCDLPPEACPACKAIETGQPARARRRPPALTGTYLCSAYPLPDPEGQVQRVIHVLSDITALKEARDALQQSEARYRRLVEHSHGGIWEIDRNGVTLFANGQMAHILGFQCGQELVGRRFYDFLARTYPDTSLLFQEKGVARGRPIECVLRKADGSAVHAILSSLPRYDETGYFADATLFVTDITWQRHLEDTLEQTKTRYQTLFEHAGDAILIHDLSGRLVAANQLACWRLGYSLEELLDMTMADIEAPEYAEQLDARIQELQRYGHHLFETEHVRCDGKRIPIETSSRLTEYEGRPAILVIARDITERKQMQQTMLSTERLAAMGQLATAIAHEINHPLQSVLGNVNILLSFPLEEEQRRERLEIVYREAKRLIGLTRQVLDFARPTLAERRLISVADVMGYAMTLVGGELRHSRVGVQMELSRELPFVRASKDELTQVFLNLIINAMEAMPGGGQLYIRGRAIKDTVELTFADTGPGIETGMEDRIFEAFHTTKENGTGLGLAVSQTIVQQHGGTIAVSNGSRGGAVFQITLPVAVMEREQE